MYMYICIHMYVCIYVRMFVSILRAYTYNYTHMTLQANFQPIHIAAAGGKADVLKYLGKLPGVDVHAINAVRNCKLPYIANCSSFAVAKLNCNSLENICSRMVVFYGQSLLHRLFH